MQVSREVKTPLSDFSSFLSCLWVVSLCVSLSVRLAKNANGPLLVFNVGGGQRPRQQEQQQQRTTDGAARHTNVYST